MRQPPHAAGVALGDAGRPATARRAGTITRDRLVSRLTSSSDASCVTVIAPAGYGKTTLLVEWADSDPRAVAWLTLDERHQDPGLLIASIVGALDEIEPLDGSLLEPLASPQSDFARVIVPRLCGSLDGRERFVLILDDVHALRGSEAVNVIAELAACLPPSGQLVLAAREEPAIGLGRLRAKRDVAEIGMSDMSMTNTEASRLFRASGRALERPVVANLVEHTEGWPAALYLAALWLERADDPAAAIERFTGDDRLVADYLREEFLTRIDAETLDFLTRASVLDRMSGEVCDDVLGIGGSAVRLRDLSRSNLLLVPLDSRDREYRFHALLREMLASELHRLGDGEERALHERAGRWYAAAGDPDRAVDHAISSGDVVVAGDLIWSNLPTYASSGRYSTLVRWLGSFTDEQVAGSATLCATGSIIHLIEADGAETERWAAAAERALAANARPDEPEVSGVLRLIRAVADAEGGLVEKADELAGVRAVLTPGSPWMSLCCLVEGALRLLSGEPGNARRALVEGVRMGASSAPSPYAITLAHLVLLELDEGNVEEAWAHAHEALRTIDHYGLESYSTSSLILAAAALASARRGDSGGARRLLAQACALQDAQAGLNPWYDTEARIAIAKTQILLDDVPGARSQLAVAARAARTVAGAPVLESWIHETTQAADAADAVPGRWPLTPAEIRLLHHLPTHHSFPEIAGQLFVSTNTVKTQAKSIYRKFSVSSRAEAVACARAAGLLGDE